MMEYFLEAIILAYFATALAKPSARPTERIEMKTAQCNVNNYFYAGPNSKKIEQQLAKVKQEILEEIRSLKRNETGRPVGKGM